MTLPHGECEARPRDRRAAAALLGVGELIAALAELHSNYKWPRNTLASFVKLGAISSSRTAP